MLLTAASVSTLQVSVAGCSVNRGRLLVTKLGAIKSENPNMSKDKSCEKHDHLDFIFHIFNNIFDLEDNSI